MITARVDASGVKQKLNGSSGKILAALKGSLEIQTGMLANYIRADKLSGQVLKNRTGNLRNSIVPLVEASGPLMTGTVYVDSSAVYGAYQEYGAHIPERVPVNAKALRWYAAGGSPIFAMRARAFDLPPRPFMGPSLDEKSAEITAALQTSANKAMQE
jgi:phage gpG-like protein